jgi:DNA-binding beta-propeller fold protein YncE
LPYVVRQAEDYPTFWPFAVGGTVAALYASLTADAIIARAGLTDESLTEEWAGVQERFACTPGTGDARHPLGAPMGISRLGGSFYVADPYCKTVWVITEGEYQPPEGPPPAEGEDPLPVPLPESRAVVRNIRPELPLRPPQSVPGLPGVGTGKCADGPIAFATFGAPMDVAVDEFGTIWVADAGCHSIRAIIPLSGATTLEQQADSIGEYLGNIAARVDSEILAGMSQSLTGLDADFLDAHAWWVVTVAGSTDGRSGFADGPALEARFYAPSGIAVTREGNTTYVFVSDTGNRRVRLLKVPCEPLGAVGSVGGVAINVCLNVPLDVAARP